MSVTARYTLSIWRLYAVKFLPTSNTFAGVLHELRSQRTRLSLAIGFLVFSVFSQLAQPWIVGNLVGVAIEDIQNERSFFNWLKLLTAMLLFQYAAMYVGTVLIGTVGETCLSGLRQRVHAKLLKLPLSFTIEHKKGDLVALLSNETAVVSYFFSNHIASFIPQFILLVGALAMLIYINLTFGLLAALCVFLLVLVAKIIGRNVRELARNVMEGNKKVISLFEQDVLLAEEIKVMALERKRHADFNLNNEVLLGGMKQYILRQSLLLPSASFLGSSMLLFAIGFLYSTRDSSLIEAPEIVSLLMYGFILVRPVSNFAAIYGHSQRAIAALKRLDEYFGVTDEQSLSPIRQLDIHEGFESLEFVDVGFWHNSKTRLLDRCNMKIYRGEKVFILGENGSGKTSIARLIMKIHLASSGRITINSRDVNHLDNASLRASIGFVSQHANFFSGTVYENITVGLDAPDRNAVIDALKQIGFWPWIESLSNGLDTNILELGLNLSGGQRQKLSLCRAVLRDSQFIILDEPTSMFDRDSEELFIRLLDRYLEGKTALIITHQKNTLTMADKVYVLRDHQLWLQA